MDHLYELMVPVSPWDLENILLGRKTIMLTKKDPSKIFSTVYLYQTRDPHYKYQTFQNLKPLQGKVVGQVTCEYTTKYEGEFWDDSDVYEAVTRYIPSEDPEDEDYPFLMWSNEQDGTYEDSLFAQKTCTTYKQLKKWLGIGLNEFYGLVINTPILYDKPRNLCEFSRPCICPKMSYCPACKYGYEYMSEDEAEFYRMGEGANTEWYCHNVVKNPPAPFIYCIYNPEGKV